MTLLPLKTVEDYLDPAHFLRVHKSYLVALSKIDGVESNEITIQNLAIPISRNLRENVVELVVKAKLLSK